MKVSIRTAQRIVKKTEDSASEVPETSFGNPASDSPESSQNNINEQ